jgi:hypothetical protein
MSDENPKPSPEKPPGGNEPQVNWRGLALFSIALALIGGAFFFSKPKNCHLQNSNNSSKTAKS